MTLNHYIVFIGANADLSTQLKSMEARIVGARIVAPAMNKKQVGATQIAISKAMESFVGELSKTKCQLERTRFSLWLYDPGKTDQILEVFNAFGHSAWVETVPRNLINKNRLTREYVEKRINAVRRLLHVVSTAAYGNRNSSPLPLPLRNFNSPITNELKTHWYDNQDSEELSNQIKALQIRFKQTRDKNLGGYKDEKDLIFKPARKNEYHGLVRLTGSDRKPLICGRFRYGVALFPGFHYDVAPAKTKTLKVDLKTSSGTVRSMKSEDRNHINIFPNDHLLPAKK